MGFGAAVRRVLPENHAHVRGRAGRAEFRWFLLFQLIAGAFAGIIDGMLGVGLLQLLLTLALILPTAALAVRCLHDADTSGWWALLLLIPLVGLIAMVVIGLRPGTAEANRFGPPPRPMPAA